MTHAYRTYNSRSSGKKERERGRNLTDSTTLYWVTSTGKPVQVLGTQYCTVRLTVLADRRVEQYSILVHLPITVFLHVSLMYIIRPYKKYAVRTVRLTVQVQYEYRYSYCTSTRIIQSNEFAFNPYEYSTCTRTCRCVPVWKTRFFSCTNWICNKTIEFLTVMY